MGGPGVFGSHMLSNDDDAAADAGGYPELMLRPALVKGRLFMLPGRTPCAPNSRLSRRLR